MTPEEARQTARFLRAHPPFDSLADDAVERVAACAELESYGAGDVVFDEGAEPVGHLRVIRSGTVELATRGKVLDVLAEGDVFGHGSLLSGLPTAFSARAVEDSSCYTIPAEQARAVLSGQAGVQFVARSLLEEPTELHILAREPAVNTADQPVGSLVRGDPAVCGPDTTIREAAQLMSAGPGTAVVVDLGPQGLGILTDRDLRTKVVAAGMSVDDPVSAAMSAPAYTCTADRRAGEVLAEMFDRGLRHFPVLSSTGQVVGVVEDVDLVALRTRSSFYLRQRIATARSDEELVTVSRELRPMVVSLFDAGVAASNVMSVYAVCVDALTRRLLTLALDRRGGVDAEFAWLALGSQARREALPSSDVDSAIVWFESAAGSDEETRTQLLELAREVTGGLRACGLRDGRERGHRRRRAVRALGGVLAARGPELDERSDAGQGADPHLGDRRQPAGVGRPHGHAGGRHLPPGFELPPPDPHARPLRALASARHPALPRAWWWSTAASIRERSTSSTAGSSRSWIWPGGARCRPASRAPRRPSACRPRRRPAPWRPPTRTRSRTPSSSSTTCAWSTRWGRSAPDGAPTTTSTPRRSAR